MSGIHAGEGDRLPFLLCCAGVVLLSLGAWWLLAQAALCVLWMFWGIA